MFLFPELTNFRSKNEFVRRLRLRKYFHGHDDNGVTITVLSEHPPKIQKHTNKNRIPESDRNIFFNSYIKVIEKIGKANYTKIYSNISNQERKALSKLKVYLFSFLSTTLRRIFQPCL